MRTLESGGVDGARELAPWFHNLHLPGGRQTAPDHPLGDFPRWKWDEIAPHLPVDLSGARALDIGCNAGFYTFELARRGADVLAIDIDQHYLRQARWARRELGLEDRVELRQMSVYDLARLDAKPFDVILFLGVLYHLRHPLLALDLVADASAGTVVFQTLTLTGDERLATPNDLDLGERERMRGAGWPTMAFIEHELAGDPTNWWAPDAACVEAMLRTSGLEVVEQPGHEFWICRPGRRTSWTEHAVRAELASATGRARTASGTIPRLTPPPAPPAFQVERGLLPPELIADALRVIHLDLLERGASASELGEWLWGMHWFPHLNYREEVLALAAALPAHWQSGTLCDPQILLQFPHTGPEPEVTFHVDQEPKWAQGRRYQRIVGVPLSPWRRENGGLMVKPPDGELAVELDPGDAVLLPPDLLHSGGVNRTGSIRYGVYFRWLDGTGEVPPLGG
jgi:tRNA (mo5U34)-methyltransferase